MLNDEILLFVAMNAWWWLWWWFWWWWLVDCMDVNV